jgi:hypothetical protein
MNPRGAASAIFATGNGVTAGEAKIPWGFAEFFVIAQTAIPAVLYLPGTQPFRFYLRVASFGVALVMLARWAATAKGQTTRTHPAQPWAIAVLALVALMILHPMTSSTLAGVAQLALYAAVIAPFFWTPSLVKGPDHLARLMALLLICNGINAVVGVLQVYDPGRWMPPEMSRLVTEGSIGLGAVTYTGPNGRLIVRPPGLFDNPGAVAGPGMYAALLGLVFGISSIAMWKRAGAVLLSFAGIAAIYLSQVRISLIVAILMFATYAGLLTLQARAARATKFASVAALIVIVSFSFARVLGGESVAMRTATLFEQDPVSLYSASRGGQLVYTFDDILARFPLGAGLGRWGMIAMYYSGSADPSAEGLWAEIQLTGWAIDGGVPLLLLYIGALVVTLVTELRVARSHPNAKVRACASVIFAANFGTSAMIFSFTPFVTQIGLQFWFLAGALQGIAPVGRSAER